MSHTQQAADHGRRWYRLRPEPRRRADLMGFKLHILDGAGVAHRDRPDRLPVTVVVMTKPSVNSDTTTGQDEIRPLIENHKR